MPGPETGLIQAPTQTGAAPSRGRRSPVRMGALRFVPTLTVLALLLPVAAGLAGTLAPAFGWLPAAGLVEPGLGAFTDLMRWPGLSHAVWLSLTTGLLSTACALGLVALIVAGWHGTRAFVLLQRLLSPLLSVPHAAAAFGLAFLIAPSGWIARLISPWPSGWDKPPDVLIVQDPLGLAMVAGLIIKEVPFLLLMTLAALGQSDGTRAMAVARALGYGRVSGWMRCVFPRVYAQIRLPVYVVLAYAMSVVDVALILGPSTPPTLAVQITKWMSDPDLTLRGQASAAALLQLGLVGAGLLGWRLAERVVAALGRRVLVAGGRGRLQGLQRAVGAGAGVLVACAVLVGLAGLAVWSVAGFWAFPDAWPSGLSWRSWARHGPGLWDAAAETILLAGMSAGLALLLVMACLEAEHRSGKRMGQGGTLILYLPLLVPQIAFLPGLQTLFLAAGAQTGRGPVIAAHLVFVLPYVFLSLGDPWRAWDTRLATIGAALGATPCRVMWRLRVPMLLAPILTAFAVGFAVSVGQYLPTLLVGGGRIQTLTTEAVALSAGGDRRAIGVFALAQTVAALLPFALALALPAFVWRNRRGVLDG